MKIAVACDHGGLVLKNSLLKYLRENGYEVEDFGTCTEDSCDYPDFALPAAEAVARGECERGILICSTGIGVSIAANKVKGAYAALVSDIYSAERARKSNDANIACFGAFTVGYKLLEQFALTFLDSEFVPDCPSQPKVDRIRFFET